MKKFTNLEVSLPQMVEGKEEKMDYSDLLSIGVNIIPEGGLTIEEMDKDLKIFNKLKKVNTGESISLEDAEFERVYNAIPEKWTVRNEDIIKFKSDMDKIHNKD